MDQQHLEGAEKQQEMSFVDHLEVLRWHIIRSLASILVFAVAAFLAKDFVFNDVILAPSRTDFLSYTFMCDIGKKIDSAALCIEDLGFTIQSRQMSGQFSMHMMVSLTLGLALAFPYTFWEIWRFVKPGLYPQEQKSSRGAVFWVSILFVMGLLFGYYVVAPMSINFLAGYQVHPSIKNEFDLSSYISTLTTLCLACAFMFELPVIVYFFTKAGLLSPEIMKVYRRHAIVGILILSAIITPPDVISQLLIAFPLIILYEVSISVSRRIIRRDLKKLNENNA